MDQRGARSRVKYFALMLMTVQWAFMSITAKGNDLESRLYRDHHLFLEEKITQRRFKHHTIMEVLSRHKANPALEIKKIGESAEGRSINLVRIGDGQIKILLWSQMHGDESTATMALMDIFNFFSANQNYAGIKEVLTSRLTLYFVPMLNPDGAERFQRRNAVGIDLNRDALRLAFSESVILKRLVDDLQPDFGFNLHDQDTLYSAGKSAKPATISFLAPPVDDRKSMSQGRLDAMRLIALLNRRLQEVIPGQVARYSDDFEPRAFGDNVQKWGVSTVLVESGGYARDPEKQTIRKLNFVLLISAFHAIANGDYEGQDEGEYDAIPKNEERLFHLLIREAMIAHAGKQYTVDIGINRKEIDASDHLSYHYRSFVGDVGDLSTFWGYEEIDARGYVVVEGKTFEEAFNSVDDVDEKVVTQLLREGYTEIRVRQKPDAAYALLPVSVLHADRAKNNKIEKHNNPNFFLRKNNKNHYAIINGFIFDLVNNKNNVRNTLVN